jgi:hypothetical protein
VGRINIQKSTNVIFYRFYLKKNRYEKNGGKAIYIIRNRALFWVTTYMHIHQDMAPTSINLLIFPHFHLLYINYLNPTAAPTRPSHHIRV